MIIEILYPELGNLFGDMGNTDYLRASLPNAEFVMTGLKDTPRFMTEKVDMLYLASCTERSQELILAELMPMKERLAELIAENTLMLLTGNACELFGNEIETEDGRRIAGLQLIPCRAKRFLPDRVNSLYIGTYGDLPVTGYTSRFSHLYEVPAEMALFTNEKGLGSCPESKTEGYRFHNVFGTYLLGPLLVLNPDFTSRLLALLGAEDPLPAFYDAAKKAYEIRLAEYRGNIGFGFHA